MHHQITTGQPGCGRLAKCLSPCLPPGVMGSRMLIPIHGRNSSLHPSGVSPHCTGARHYICGSTGGDRGARGPADSTCLFAARSQHEQAAPAGRRKRDRRKHLLLLRPAQHSMQQRNVSAAGNGAARCDSRGSIKAASRSAAQSPVRRKSSWPGGSAAGAGSRRGSLSLAFSHATAEARSELLALHAAAERPSRSEPDRPCAVRPLPRRDRVGRCPPGPGRPSVLPEPPPPWSDRVGRCWADPARSGRTRAAWLGGRRG